ncbi:MAG: hypothetical protein IPF47_16700 [Gemmatimonadetes bacterium]|nr:hypothetical protein [Gemmatimonadota bacterium]
MRALLRFPVAAAFASLLVAPAVAAQGGSMRDVVYEASISELQDGLQRGRWSAVQLVDAYRARIAAYDQRGPALNAIIRLNPNARRDAAALDAERTAGKVRGALHGIPILLRTTSTPSTSRRRRDRWHWPVCSRRTTASSSPGCARRGP